MRKIGALLVSLILLFAFAACANKDGNRVESDNPLRAETVKLRSFGYGDVTLTDGPVKDCYDRTKDYYLAFSVDDMLYGMRQAVGLPRGGEGQAIPGLGVGGNVLGQWISANARFCAALGTEELKARCRALAEGLAEISARSPILVDGLGMYAFEKYLRALTDLYTLCGQGNALDAAKAMVEYAMANPIYADAKLVLGNNGPDLEIEWYTIAESLYEFSEAALSAGYSAAEVKRYREFAAKFEYRAFWDIFLNDKDLFDYSPQAGQNTDYFHAYSHLNSFNSAARAYAVRKTEDYLSAMKKFHAFMLDTEVMATGGYGAHVEWLAPRPNIIGYLQKYHDNFETQCDTYAVFRQENYLANYTGLAAYGNWTEKLLYNAMLASLDIRDGYAFYYSDYNTSGGRKELRWDWRWACCAGSRPLVTNELLRSVYFHDTKNLYVNLFVNSSVTFETGGSPVTLTQQSGFPAEDTVRFTVSAENAQTFSLKFRRPDWLAGEAAATVNGEIAALRQDTDGWLVVNREWRNGDTLELTLPMAPYISAIQDEFEYGPDGVFAVCCGPVTLAAATPSAYVKPTEFLDGKASLAGQLVKGADALHYAAAKNAAVTLKPFYEYGEGELYYLYMNLYDYDLFG